MGHRFRISIFSTSSRITRVLVVSLWAGVRPDLEVDTQLLPLRQGNIPLTPDHSWVVSKACPTPED